MKQLDEQLKEQIKNNTGVIEINIEDLMEPQQIQQDQQLQDQLQQNQQNNEGEIEVIREENIILGEKLEEKREEVKENVPEPLPEEIHEQTKVARKLAGQQTLPKELTDLLDEVSAWVKVKEETSKPVKETAAALKEAKTDEDAALYMGILYNACLNYLSKNDNKWFKSSARKKAVRNILSQIADFTKNARSVYLDQLSKQTSGAKESYSEDDAARQYIDKFDEKMKENFSDSEQETTIEEETQKRKTAEETKESEEDAIWSKHKAIGELVAGGTIKEVYEKTKDISAAPLKMESKNYTGENAEDQKIDDLQTALLFVKSNSFKPEMSRSMALISQDTIKKVGLQCKEIQKFCKKYSIALTDEENEMVERYVAISSDVDSLLASWSELITSPGFISIQQKGFKVTVGDSMEPVMTIRQLRAMNGKAVTAEEKDAYNKLEEATEAWYRVFGADAEATEKAGADYFEAIRNAEKMSDEELMAAQDKYDKVLEYDNAYLKRRAKGTSCNMSNKRDDTAYQRVGMKLNMVHDLDPEANAEIYIALAEHVENFADNKYPDAAIAKAQAMEQVFDILRGFDIKSFSIKKGEKYYGKLDKRFSKISFALDVEKLIEEYDKLIEQDRFPEDAELRYDEEERADLVAKIKTIKEIGRRLGSKPASDVEFDAKEISEEFEIERLNKIGEADEASELSQKVLTRMDANLREKLDKDQEILATGFSELMREQTEEEKNLAKEHLKIVRDEELTVEQKKRNEKRLTAVVNSCNDARIKFRSRIPLDIKKQTDYRSFESLSEFAFFSGGEQMLEKLIKAYSEGQKNKKKRATVTLDKSKDHSAEINSESFEALDIMTSELMKVNVGAFDISTDEAIARNGAELEKLARAVETYNRLVGEAGGEQYFDYLSQMEQNGINLGIKMKEQLEKLTAVAGYYRVRRLLIEDEGYIAGETKNFLAYNRQDGDSFETARLRELMQASTDYEKSIRKLTRGKEYKPSDFDDITAAESTTKRLENQRYSVAPKWLQNAFSLTELKTKNEDPEAMSCCTLNGGNHSVYYAKAQSKLRGNDDVYDYYMKELPKTLHTGKLADSPKFKYGNDTYLEMDISDNWARIALQVSNALRYRRSASEMQEMCDNLQMQNKHEWYDIQDDPAAVEFYESAFKEMTMRFISGVYANVRRVTNSIGLKMLFMHTIDLNLQMTTQLRNEIMGATVASNIDTPTNMEKVKKLFDQNNQDHHYDFDAEDFVSLASISDMSAWKTVNAGQGINHLLKQPDTFVEDDLRKEADEEDVMKAVFGKKNADDIARRDLEEYKNRSDADHDVSGMMFWEYYLLEHPELFSLKTYMTKTDNGEFVFQKNLQICTRSVFNESTTPSIIELVNSNKLKPLDPEEMAAYEKSLKDRKMPGVFLAEDPYGIESYKQGYKNLIKKDEKGNPIMVNGKPDCIELVTQPDFDAATGQIYED